MNLENYDCEGQMELTDYLKSLEQQRIEKLGKCLDCIYLIGDKCKRQSCYFVAAVEGWNPLWYIGPKCFGTFPLNQKWQNAEAIEESADGRIYKCKCRVKDKTWIWPKEEGKGFYDNTIAWRYVQEKENQAQETEGLD